jgi:predicted phosphodiesterase
MSEMKNKPIGYRLFYSLSIILLLSIIFSCETVQHSAAANTDEQDDFVIAHGPYLQLLTENSVVIVWHTSRNCVSTVEYGVDRLDQTAIQSHHGLIDNDSTSQQIRITGLQPGTTYKYRIVSQEFKGYTQQHLVTFGETVVSDEFSFTTLDRMKDDFSFCAFSDIHERAEHLQELFKLVNWPTTDFVVYNGDMVNDFMVLEQPFHGFVDVSIEKFAKTKPFVYVRGNHDVRGRFAQNLADFFPTHEGRAYYSFDHGPVHFIVLDSGEDKIDSHEYYNGLVDFQRYREEQAKWVKQDLASENAMSAQYTIALSHIPPLDRDRFMYKHLRSTLEQPLNDAKIDLWLSGHTHKFARLDPTTGGAAYTLIVGATDTMTQVDVSKNELNVSVIRRGGELLDSLTLTPK